MISLSFLFWATLVTAFIMFWWKSDQIKLFAIAHIIKYCRVRHLQLLDQTMVLKGLWPIRSNDGSLRLRRRYHFEFTSTGKIRNLGIIELIGRKIHKLELEAHLLPEDNENLH